MSAQYDGTFDFPTVARRRRPVGMVGPGTVLLTDEVLVVTGARVATSLMSGAGIFGVVVVPLVAALAGYPLLEGTRDLVLTQAAKLSLGLGALLALALMAVVRTFAKRRLLRFALSWKGGVADIESAGSTIAFRSTRAPRGWIYFTAASPADAASLAGEVSAHLGGG